MDARGATACRQKVKPSELINIQNFTSSWKEHVDTTLDFSLDDSDVSYIQQAMGIPEETATELAGVCSPSTLDDTATEREENTNQSSVSSGVTLVGNSSDMTPRELLYTSFPEDIQLATVRMQKTDVEKRKMIPDYQRARLRRMKYKCRDELLWRETGVHGPVPEEFRVDPGTVALTVRVYRPFLHSSNRRSRLYVDHAYLVLGSQSLTDLRDKIRCVSDLMVEGDFSNNPDLPSDHCARDFYKSAFFFIENTFYNDMRDPDCRDYSREVMNWALEKPRGLPVLKSVSMDGVRFGDLSLRLGQPYLYMHQANCEHLIIFSDIRMVHPHDLQDVREYPQMITRRTRMRAVCAVCRHRAARWVTKNDELAPENPCFFCEPCFRSLHYDEHGRKVCQFEAYKYVDSHVVL